MDNLFVPYKEACQLKIINFKDDCIAYYNIQEAQRTGVAKLCYTIRGKEIDKETLRLFPEFHQYLRPEHCIARTGSMAKHRFVAVAPTWDQCFEWFREKHGLICEISYDGSFYYTIKSISEKYDNYDILLFLRDRNDLEFKTYKEAQKNCLNKMIEFVKNKTS